jgi:hypothetical protein
VPSARPKFGPGPGLGLLLAVIVVVVEEESFAGGGALLVVAVGLGGVEVGGAADTVAADAMAESEASLMSRASVPGLKASPVLASVQLSLVQQL